MGIFGLFSSKTPNEANKNRSYHWLANNYKCELSEVKSVYLRNLRKEKYSLSQVKDIIPILERRCIEQGKNLRIHPEDTPEALLKEWTNEYIGEQSELSSTVQKFLKDKPELAKIMQSGDEKAIGEYLKANKDTSRALAKEMIKLGKSNTSSYENFDDLPY